MRSGPDGRGPERPRRGRERSHQGRRAQGPEYHRVPVPLTRLDLRGVPAAELAAALPRPAAEESFPSEAVRAILDEVRAGGDDAVRALTRRFDGVDVDLPAGAPPPTSTAALGGLDPDLRGALELAYDADPRLPPPRAGTGAGLRERRGRRPPPRPAGGARRAVRPGGPGALSLDRAHVRRPGPGGRGGRARAVRAPRPRRRHRGRDAGGGRHRRHRRGLPGGRRPGRGGHGLRHRVHPARRRHRRARQPLRGRGQAPGVGHRRRPVRLRRPLRGRGGGRRRPPRWRGPPSTSSSRPSTAPTAWPGW